MRTHTHTHIVQSAHATGLKPMKIKGEIHYHNCFKLNQMFQKFQATSEGKTELTLETVHC